MPRARHHVRKRAFPELPLGASLEDYTFQLADGRLTNNAQEALAARRRHEAVTCLPRQRLEHEADHAR